MVIFCSILFLCHFLSIYLKTRAGLPDLKASLSADILSGAIALANLEEEIVIDSKKAEVRSIHTRVGGSLSPSQNIYLSLSFGLTITYISTPISLVYMVASYTARLDILIPSSLFSSCLSIHTLYYR